jgi:hypothetical protein
VQLPEFGLLEQADLVEAERRSLLIEFGKEAVQVFSTAKDHDKAVALLEELRKIYFIGYEEKQKRQIREQADELIRLSQLTYRISPKPGGGGILQVTNE